MDECSEVLWREKSRTSENAGNAIKKMFMRAGDCLKSCTTWRQNLNGCRCFCKLFETQPQTKSQNFSLVFAITFLQASMHSCACFTGDNEARVFTPDDVVSQRLGFVDGIFSSVSQIGMCFLTFPFPVPFALGSRDVPKNCASLLALTSNQVQVRLGWTQTDNVKGKVQSEIHRRN